MKGDVRTCWTNISADERSLAVALEEQKICSGRVTIEEVWDNYVLVHPGPRIQYKCACIYLEALYISYLSEGTDDKKRNEEIF